MQQSIRPAPSRQRPTRVTFLAILAALGGVGIVLGVLAGALVIHGLDSLDTSDAVIVLPALALSALYLASAYAAWTLKSWGWTLGVVAGVATIVYTAAVLVGGWAELMRDAPPLAMIGVVIALIAAGSLFALFRPEAKAAFGRG